MTILVAALTLLVILLAILVVALLRSHAEILRRLDGVDSAEERLPGKLAPGMPRPRGGDGAPEAVDLVGRDLAGDAVQVGLAAAGPSTLIAFLTSGCLTCHGFWRSFASAERPAIPGGARLVIVTKDSAHESPARLRDLAPADVPLVMSTDAWERYEVPTAPYFVYVDGPSGEVHGEGAASGWPQVVSLLRDALDDAAEEPRSRSGASRANRIELDLERAGIGPGHPSLYPGSERSAGEGAR
jgi:hypothetical protein